MVHTDTKKERKNEANMFSSSNNNNNNNTEYLQFAQIVVEEEGEVFDEDPTLGRNTSTDPTAGELETPWPPLPIIKALEEEEGSAPGEGLFNSTSLVNAVRAAVEAAVGSPTRNVPMASPTTPSSKA